jgi:hypothetical protein
MQALTAGELAGFRDDLAGAMPDRCTIERDASQDAPRDPFGHPPPPEWVDHLAGVPCSVWQAGGETTNEPVEATTYRHLLAVPHGTDVRASDRIGTVLDAAGLARLGRPVRIDAVVPRASHIELTLAEVSW